MSFLALASAWILPIWVVACQIAQFPQPAETPLLRRRRRRGGQELGESQQRVAAHREGRQEADFLLADHLHLAHRPPILAPAKALLDALSNSLAGEVTGMACGASIDRRATLLADVHRHMRGHPA